MAYESDLTPFEVAFVGEYIHSNNATRAYIRTFSEFHDGRTVGYFVAADAAKRLLKKPQIQDEISAARASLRKRHRATAAKVIKQLSKTAFASIDEIVDLSSGRPVLRRRRDMPAGALGAIQEISETRYGIRIKMKDSTAALKELAAILGLHHEPDALEVLIARIPAGFQEQVRQALANALRDNGDPPLPGSEQNPTTGLRPAPGEPVAGPSPLAGQRA